MQQWQKHVLGLVLPLAVGATTLALAPEYDAPDWMINVSAGGIGVAIVYAVFLYVGLARRGGNFVVAPLVMAVIGCAGWLVGQLQNSMALVALGGLVPLSGMMLAIGYLHRRSGQAEREAGLPQ